jgi:hypothetical protein
MSKNKSSDQERNDLRQQYPIMYDAVMEVLFRHDPMRIKEPFRRAGLEDVFEVPMDEYEPETQTILPRLEEAHSALELRKIVHEEFIRWFDPHLAKEEENYTQVAEAIWSLYLRNRQ